MSRPSSATCRPWRTTLARTACHELISRRPFSLLLTILLLLSGTAASAASWQQTSGPAGGNIEAVALAPGDANTLYAGGRSGTLFRSDDAGLSWSPLATIDLAAIIHQILVSPTDPQLLYVSTGTLYRSSDGGLTMEQVAGVGGVNRLAVSPQNEQVLAVASPDGSIYLSDDGFATVRAVSGPWAAAPVATVAFGPDATLWAGTATGGDGRLYRSADKGVSWTEITVSPRRTATDISSILVDPADPATVFVGLRDVNNEAFAAATDPYLLKTTDGGNTFTDLHVPNMDSVLNVLGKENSTLVVGTGAYLFKSADTGQSWTDISPPARQVDGAATLVLDGPTIYAPTPFGTGVLKSSDLGENWSVSTMGLTNVSISLLAAPVASSTLYATSVNGEGTFRTRDNGATWENVVFNGISHRWADELQVSPHNDQEIWQVADVGEIFRSGNGGDTWEKIITPYGAGFRYGSIYALASAPAERTRLYGLRSGFGIYRSVDRGESWAFLHHSEVDYSYAIAVHSTEPDTVYSGFLPKPFQDFAMVRKSVDGGATWTTALRVVGSTGITSVAVDPSSPATVYAGSSGAGGAVWKSNDGGTTWQQPNPRFTFTNVHTLTVDPADPDVAYAGIWGGGTWKTADGGASWARLANDPTISASAILVDPTDSNIIYIADRTAPRIYKTTNGGGDWAVWFDAGPAYYRVMNAKLAPATPDTLLVSVFLRGGPMQGDLFRVDRGVATKVTANLPRLPVSMAAHPHNRTVLYAVTHMQGLYKSVNGGASWTDLTGGGTLLPLSVGFRDLVLDPVDPNTLYLIGGSDVDATLSHRGADPAAMNTVYKSTDGGASWVNCNDGSFGSNSGPVTGLSVSPLDADHLFAATAGGLLRSGDGGTTWTRADTGLNYTHLAGTAVSGDGARLYCPTLGGGVYTGDISPADASIAWAGASTLAAEVYHVLVRPDPADSATLYASAYPGGMFKSRNGGASWQECNFGMASFRIDDPRRQGYYAFAISESSPLTLYLGLYGVGIYKSTDGAATWMPMNGTDQIMRGRPVSDLLIDPADGDTVVVAGEDGVYRTTDGGITWSALNAGLDTLDVRTLAWADNGMIYAGTRGNEVYLLETNGQWRQLPGFCQYGTFWPIWNDRPLYQYTSLLFHPTDPDILYIGTFPAGIYQSIDGGAHWREKNVGFGNDGVFSLVFRPGDPSVILAGTYNGLSLSEDGGDHWRKWSQGWPAEQWVFSIDFDPRDPEVIYACSKNGENEGLGRAGFHGTVMKSVNGGRNWFAITGGLDPDNEFYKIVVDRHFPDTLYLASQHEGVFVSANGGTSWTPFNEGLTNIMPGTNGNNVTNTMLGSADGNYLYFGSNGSGVFSRKLHDDADNDGLADAWELAYWQDTTAGDPGGDDDGDGATNRQEYIALSNPRLDDTDGDGLPDPWEILYRLHPLVNDAAVDIDRDGYTNLEEYQAVTSPVDAASKPSPPLVVTLAATAISLNAATLNGTVSPRGFATRIHFDYGTSTAYGSTTPTTDIGPGTAELAVSATVTGFPPNTPCHYRLVAETAYDLSQGEDASFTFVVTPGDIDLSGSVDLADVLTGMQLLASAPNGAAVHPAADTDGDGSLGVEDIVHALQKAAGLRP